jgi:hypothetical protein
MKTWFQSLLFKFNLCRYTVAELDDDALADIDERITRRGRTS